MLRFFFRAVGPLLTGTTIFAQPDPAAPESILPPSVVVYAHHPGAIHQWRETARVSRQLVDELVVTMTGAKDVAAAWLSLVSREDRVGIKVCTSGGPRFSSHRGVVEGIIGGLVRAGVSRERIIVWDRDAEELAAAGFDAKSLGVAVRAIEPVRGYDVEAKVTGPNVGRLIWGDVLFTGRKPNPLDPTPTEKEQLSATSHLPTVLSREVTKVINVPVLSDEVGCGIAGAFYNMTARNTDNWRRFTQADPSAGEAMVSVYADERIGGKVVLHVMDGLVAQFAYGPHGNPNYAFEHETLYMSKDPVALDATALRQLEMWRQSAKLPAIGRRAGWLKFATEMGLGNHDSARIDLKPIPAAR